ncbi:putative disease resistance RPP13-like protein 3 [Quercus lobata]|uniref:putative disease resistance RPP13-like protein 3 n=1 Tax=Quercus lobata TaxID=97700 RepID=UPI0012467809|nr:putative disease resistance RPP13-like protein 3 [Quercus lobata]
MVAEVPVIILLEKLRKLQIADERVRPPELRAAVVTAVNELRHIFSFLTKPNQTNITENLKGLLDSIYSADNTTESVLTTVQGRRKGVTETKLLEEFRRSFGKVSVEFYKFGPHDLPNENVDPITVVSEQAGFQYDQELYVLTGREEEEKELVRRLIKDDEKCLRAIALVSEKELGKTALARTVYNKPVIRQHFQCRAWVHIPKDLECKDLLIIILRTIPDCVLQGIELWDESKLTAKLVESLMKHRFLVVLDNVFQVDIWHMLARSFADARNGSRVILTTRLSDVAMDADPWSSPMKLAPLTPQKSWEFFLKKAGREDNSDLNEFMDKILRVCNGFPAAILLLGGLLSTIQLSEWAEVINHVAGEDQSTPSNIVDWSYHKLPCVLKPCFLYLTIFPKAYEIPIRRLLHLWLAEGFVPISSEANDVNVAKKYFDELVRRNMIEIQRWKPDGTPKTCLMPCYLYDVYLPKAEDIGFLHVSHGKSDTSEGSIMFNIQRLARRFGNDSSVESHIEHLRSYVSFNDQKVNRSSREIARSPKKLITETGSSPLKVLDLEGVYKPMTPSKLRELQNLRFEVYQYNHSAKFNLEGKEPATSLYE